MKKLSVIFRVILVFLIFCLAACATGGNKVFLHTVEFDAYRDSPDIEVLDYQYGDQKKILFSPEKERIKLGQTFKYDNTTGFLPRGDYIYAKWRIKKTGEVIEDRVDLRDKLPDDLKDVTIHFVCHGRQLYVFLRWPWDEKPWSREPSKDEYKPIPSGAKRYEGHKIQQIYPAPTQQ